MKIQFKKMGVACFMLFMNSYLFVAEAAATNMELPSAATALYFDQVLDPGDSYSSNPETFAPRFIGSREYQKYNFGDVISYNKSYSDDAVSSIASALGVVKTTVPSIYLGATTSNAAVQVDALFRYYFRLNSEENKTYDVLVNAFGESKSGASVSKDGLYDYRFYGEINIDGLYTASVCSGDSSVRYGEICSNNFGEPIGTHNTFGEGVIKLQSNQLYLVSMYASILLQTADGTGAGHVYVDPIFSLLDPTIQNVSFQFSEGIQNMASPSPVPAPAATWLFASGLPLISVAARRKKQSV